MAHEVAEFFLCESEFPCRVDVHGRSLRDSLVQCSCPQPQSALVEYRTAFGIRLCAACRHCSSHLRVRHCVHVVVWKMTLRTGVLTS